MNDQQGMSPKRTSVLEGEVSGPSYDAVSSQQDALQDGVAASSQPVMNGAGTAGMGSVSGGNQATMSLPAGTSSPPPAAEFLSDSGPLIRDDQGPSVSADAPQEVPVVDVGLSQGSVQGHERMFEFSPPESLPPEQGHQSASSQVMWFARIGEFVQRRVAQAGAAMNPLMEARTQRAPTQALRTPSPRTSRLFTPEAEQTMTQWTRRAPYLYTPEQRAHEESSSASLTQEQILAEVQKQVRMEMKVHHEERQALTLENRQLKDMLERVLAQVQTRGLDGEGRDEWRGNPRGPQGSVPEELSDGRGGNPGGLRQPPAEAAGDPSKAQPAPGLRAPLGSEGAGARDARIHMLLPGRREWEGVGLVEVPSTISQNAQRGRMAAPAPQPRRVLYPRRRPW